MGEAGKGHAKALGRVRFPRHHGDDQAAARAALALARQVRQGLVLRSVNCTVAATSGALAGVVTLQLVLTNERELPIAYRVESVTVDIQGRAGEAFDVSESYTLVAPGADATLTCPPIRGINCTSPSAGNIDYVIVYGPSAMAPAERYRRQHGIWVRLENGADRTMHARFVERYVEDDAVA